MKNAEPTGSRPAVLTVSTVPATAHLDLSSQMTKPFRRRSLPHMPRGTTADLTTVEGGATTQWWCSGWEIAEWPDGTRELRPIPGVKPR